MRPNYVFDGVHMPFGQHTGKPIRELPDDYLRWLIKNLKGTAWLVQKALRVEGHRRFPKEFLAPGGCK